MKKLLFLGALLLSTVCMNAQTSEYYQKIDKRKNTSYLSNNCKYDVFYNYVKILNLMTLLSGAVFNCLTYGKKVSTSIKSGDALPPEV